MRAVKFGIFYEHQIPRPWDEHSEYRQFQQALDQTIKDTLQTDRSIKAQGA